MNDLFKRLRSKKFVMAAIGVLSLVVDIGITPETKSELVKLVMVYLGTQGTVDAVKSFKEKKDG